MNKISENDLTKLDILNEIRDMIIHNIMCYASNMSLETPKPGFEREFAIENRKLILIEQMIKEEKQNKKKRNKEAR